MAEVVVSMRLMPRSPESNLSHIEEKARHAVKEFGGEVGKVELQPVAFGLRAVILYFVMDESLGSTESLEETIKKIGGVQSAEVTDVRRAVG